MKYTLIVICFSLFLPKVTAQNICAFERKPQAFPIRHWTSCTLNASDTNCVGKLLAKPPATQTFQNRHRYRLQTQVVFKNAFNKDLLTLRVQGLHGVQKVFWDQVKLYTNGTLNAQNKITRVGRYHFFVAIPDSLSQQGTHTLTIIYQQLKQAQFSRLNVFLGDFEIFNYHEKSNNRQMVLMLTIFLTSALFFLIFYFGFGQKASFLFLSLYCIFYAIKSTLKPYQNFYVPDFLIPYLSFEYAHLVGNIAGVLLIAFLIWELTPKYRWRHLGAFLALSIASFFILSEARFLFLMMFWGGAIIAYGLYRRAKGVIWILVGLLGFFIFMYLWVNGTLGYGYFLGVIFFIVSMTVSVGQKVARQIKLRQAAMLHSAVLENQLLKKSIQPHFILNSLASLQELIEQNTEQASDFVEKLADEFRLLSQVAHQSLILLSDEIEMCKTHLKIMQYRKNACFEFITERLSGNEQVPPGIFHTLVENAITHGYGVKRQGKFVLCKSIEGAYTIYSFFNDGEVQAEDLLSQANGTGFKYIEARLQESYPDRWHLERQIVNDGWEVKIQIKH
ncbi:MAG TPA: hypothetical protein DCS93_13630 [Microscillaceae bacterium]|nr:hypothetical protein [Microscillaceae bacterium]